ncbi:MAG: hypothetical protein E7317_13070, partial [Clostridiales bacterium]|nr:hypothetical protein [Clostridiales bacterium]
MKGKKILTGLALFTLLMPAALGAAAGTEVVTDDAGRVISETFVDEAGAPVKSESGYAVKQYAYSEDGLEATETYLSVSGKQVADADGIYRVMRTYDGAGNVISVRYYNKKDELTKEPVTGACGEDLEYDEAGRCVRRSLISASGKVGKARDGWAVVELGYDENGFVSSERYFSNKGKAVSTSGGYAGLDRVNDAEGRAIRETYLNAKGKPAKNAEGLVTVEMQYGEGTLPEVFSYFNAKGNAMK